MSAAKRQVKRNLLKDFISRIKKTIRRKRNPVQAKPAFKWNSEEASCYLVRHRGKLRFFRVPFFERKVSNPKQRRQLQKLDAEKHFLETSIFHSLFPEHSIEPVALKREKTNRGVLWGTVTEILRERSTGYNIYQQEIYEHGNPGVRDPRAFEHSRFCGKEVGPLSKKILSETGILPNAHPVNTANVKGIPVFMESNVEKPEKLKSYVNSLSIPKKEKKRIINHIDRLDKLKEERDKSLSAAWLPGEK